MARRIAILGSTGSIGCSALEVLAHLGDGYRVTALSGHRRVDRLFEQVRAFSPKVVALTDSHPPEVSQTLREMGVEVCEGPDALCRVVRRDDVDVVLSAVVGAAGVPAALATVDAGKTLLLANKEALVVAGALLMPLASARGVEILPVDSEHSAIFQCLRSGHRSEVSRIILTASGGPFRAVPLEQMRRARPEDALNHPTWRMGSKITIDSATMFNKALEVIEACWLFDLPAERVEVVVHPESVVHSMVEFADGSVVAQLSPPDMRTPIQYALTYPHRLGGSAPRLDVSRAFALHFSPPDLERFPSLRMGYEAVRTGGIAGAVLNAANETAVEAFLSGNMALGDIFLAVEEAMRGHRVQREVTLDDLMQADRETRIATRQFIADRKPTPRGSSRS